MKTCLKTSLALAAALASGSASAQVGLGEGFAALASFLFALLMLFILLLWGFVTLLLIYVVPRFRVDKSRPSLKRAALQGVAVALTLPLLAIAGNALHVRSQPSSEYPDQAAEAADTTEMLNTTALKFVSTDFTAEGECHLNACAHSQFSGPGGEPLANIDYCVKDEKGRIIANGRTDKDGKARYMGKQPGERVAFEVCWISLDVRRND